MDAFESIRSQLDGTSPEAGVVWLTRKQAREILDEYDLIKTRLPSLLGITKVGASTLRAELDRSIVSDSVFLDQADAAAFLVQHDRLVETARWLVELAKPPDRVLLPRRSASGGSRPAA